MSHEHVNVSYKQTTKTSLDLDKRAIGSTPISIDNIYWK